jgi:hypothetical protein
MRSWITGVCLLLACACGEKKAPPPPPGRPPAAKPAQEQAQAPQAKPQPDAGAQARREKIAELQKRRNELNATANELRRALRELDEKHADPTRASSARSSCA